MTTDTPKGYLLHISAVCAHADAAAFAEQVRLVGTACAFNPATSTWHGTIGALDVNAFARINTLFQAARRFGTHVHLEVKPAEADHRGPVFTDIGDDLAALVAKEEDRRRAPGDAVA